MFDTKQAAWVKKFVNIDVEPSTSGATASRADVDSAGAPSGDGGGAPQPASAQTPQPASAPLSASAPTPFDAPDVQVQIDQLGIDIVRELAGTQANKAYADYGRAVDAVAGILASKAKAEADKNAQMMNVILTIGLLPLGGVIEAAGAGLAGSMLQASLEEQIMHQAPRILKSAGVNDAQLREAVTDAMVKKVTGETITRLADKFSADKAKGAVAGAADKLKGFAASLPISPDRYQCGAAYVQALGDNASSGMNKLLPAIAGARDINAALGFYNAFCAATKAVYQAQIEQQAENYMNQISAVAANKAKLEDGQTTTNDIIVKMNAYGKMRYAHVKHHMVGDLSPANYYIFVSWVTPDMEAIAEATHPQEIKPSEVQGHIPTPEREVTDDKEHNRIVRMDAWGKLRLAVVGIEDTGGLFRPRQYGVMTFIRWIEDAEAPRMEAKGALQNGGINQVQPNEVKGLKAPPT